MNENLLVKKKKVEEQVPVFEHSSPDINDAIGIPGLINGISEKMSKLVTDQSVTSPSRAVEYFYNNFTLIELSFMAMHSLGRPNDDKPKDDGSVDFEEVV